MDECTRDEPNEEVRDAGRGGWVEIRNGRGGLLCRLDAARLLLEVKRKGEETETVDLRPYFYRLNYAKD